VLVGEEPETTHTFEINLAKTLLKDKNFRSDFRTVLYAHGFNDRPDAFTAPRIVEAYQAVGRHNILLLDSSGITSLEYLR
jgi:hypothetical protein